MRVVVLAFLLLFVAPAAGWGQTLIPIEIESSTHDVLIRPNADTIVASGNQPVEVVWDSPEDGQGRSASGSLSIESSANRVTASYQASLSTTGSGIASYSESLDHIMAIQVPDLGLPTTTVAVRGTIRQTQSSPTVSAISLNLFPEHYVTPLLGHVVLAAAVGEFQPLDATMPTQQSLMIDLVPGSATLRINTNSSFGPDSSDTGSAQLEYEIELIAVPEGSASLLGLTAVGTLGALAGTK